MTVSLGEALVRADVPRRVQQLALAERGYGEIAFTDLGPRMVVASSSKIVNKMHVKAEALGIDRYDAEQKLVRMVTRP